MHSFPFISLLTELARGPCDDEGPLLHVLGQVLEPGLPGLQRGGVSGGHGRGDAGVENEKR